MDDSKIIFARISKLGKKIIENYDEYIDKKK